MSYNKLEDFPVNSEEMSEIEQKAVRYSMDRIFSEYPSDIDQLVLLRGNMEDCTVCEAHDALDYESLLELFIALFNQKKLHLDHKESLKPKPVIGKLLPPSTIKFHAKNQLVRFTATNLENYHKHSYSYNLELVTNSIVIVNEVTKNQYKVNLSELLSLAIEQGINDQIEKN